MLYTRTIMPTPDRPTSPDLRLDRVTAIVVTFNSSHCLEVIAPCLATLPHVIIVDNASSDNTLLQAQELLPNAKLIASATNVGFGAANNLAVDVAETEFVLLINPDCYFDSSAIANLVSSVVSFPNASAIAPQLLDRNGRPESNLRWTSEQRNLNEPATAGPVSVDFISGACMLIRTVAMRKIGGFDESFFLYYEDADLCNRLQSKCGPLILDPAQKVSHFSRQSVAGPKRMHAEYLRGFHHIQSKFHYREKHMKLETTIRCRARYLFGSLAGFGLRLITLQRHRAARELGRIMGVVRYQSWPAYN